MITIADLKADVTSGITNIEHVVAEKVLTAETLQGILTNIETAASTFVQSNAAYSLEAVNSKLDGDLNEFIELIEPANVFFKAPLESYLDKALNTITGRVYATFQASQAVPDAAPPA